MCSYISFDKQKSISKRIYFFKKIYQHLLLFKDQKTKQSHKTNYKIHKTDRYIESWMKKWKKNQKIKTKSIYRTNANERNGTQNIDDSALVIGNQANGTLKM